MSLIEKAKGSIQVFLQKNKPHELTLVRDGALVLIVLCVSVLSFGVSKIDHNREVICPVSIETIFGQNQVLEAVGTDDEIPIKLSPESILKPSEVPKNEVSPVGVGGRVVASKNSDKYHFPWCAGAGQIKEENKVWYTSESDAQHAGLTKAKNCQ